MSSNTPYSPLTSFSDAPPAEPVDLLFIHHSVGGQLLAQPGPLENTPEARRSLHQTHPNGGGLKALLAGQGYRVHEASYGSHIGQKTDLFDWPAKFRDAMPQVLSIGHQDVPLATGRNQVVLFKSCYPNNAFQPESATGDAHGPALTLANARAALLAVRDQLEKHPDTLFVYLTAPPLLARPEPAWKQMLKQVLGRPTHLQEQQASAALAREFNTWVTSRQGWLAGYARRNLVVFDYFSLLTGGAASNFLRYPSGGGGDNHPETGAQTRAAAALASLLNRAVRYAGVSA